MIDAIKSIDGYADLTDEQVAAILSAITVRSIPIADLENFLDFEGLASRDPITGQWTGTLPAIGSTDGHPLAPGLSKLFGHINKPRSTQIDTTQQPWATDAVALIGGLVSAGSITTAQRDAIYALAGGLRNPDGVTATQVRTAIDADADKQAKQTIRTATTGTVQALIDPLQSKLNAIDSWLATDQALAMSVADYQSFADSLLASEDGNPAGGE